MTDQSECPVCGLAVIRGQNFWQESSIKTAEPPSGNVRFCVIVSDGKPTVYWHDYDELWNDG